MEELKILTVAFPRYRMGKKTFSLLMGKSPEFWVFPED